VTLRAVLGHANVIAQAEEVVLNHLKPKPRGRGVGFAT
jgi:hypothetical protein